MMRRVTWGEAVAILGERQWSLEWAGSRRDKDVEFR